MQIEKKLFDEWAGKYEKDIHELKDVYPFAGYFKIVDAINQTIKSNKIKSILDLGVGTGFMLSEILAVNDVTYFGVDFSSEMVRYAKKRLSTAEIVEHDIRLNNPPKEIKNKQFDLIYSCYTFHHFDIPTKLMIIQNHLNLLTANGCFIIGDISFDSREELELVKIDAQKRWDTAEEEGYIISKEFIENLSNAGLKVRHEKVSDCGALYYIYK